MSVPLVTVSDVVVDQQGRPVQGAEILARLDRVEVCAGLVVPAQSRAMSGADGGFALQLFPNTLGSRGSRYEISVSLPCGELIRGWATVPEAGGLLREIMDLPGPAGFAETLVVQARTLAAQAASARDQAVAALAETEALLATHTSRTDNPHEVTAAQTGAMPQAVTATGALGEWRMLSASAGASLSLPAEGQWKYFVLKQSSAGLIIAHAASVGMGGTQIMTGTANATILRRVLK